MDALVTPSVLKWAREQSNIQVWFVARRLRVPRERVSAWEDGTLMPDVKQAREMASIYHVPFAMFYLSAPPYEIPPDILRDRCINLIKEMPEDGLPETLEGLERYLEFYKPGQGDRPPAE